MLQAPTPIETEEQRNPAAPLFSPEIWNDLPLDAKKNVQLFFSRLEENALGAVTLLRASSLFSLGALISLMDEESGYHNPNKSRIERLLSPEDIEEIKSLICRHFSYQQTRANCYAYALDFQIGFPGAKPDPGGKTSAFKHRMYENYKDAMIEGAAEDGLIHAGTAPPPLRESFYRVALFIKEDPVAPSFHWLREDRNTSRWSHKDGHGPVTCVDYRKRPIQIPDQATLGPYRLSAYFYVPQGGIKPSCLNSGL